MLIVYHVSAVITHMFYSNFISVTYDQPLNVIFFFVRTRKIDLRLNVLIFQSWASLKMFLFCCYLKSASSAIWELIFRELFFAKKSSNFFFIIFVKINFRQETYFPYFARIKFSGFHKKDILRIAVTFCMRLKKAFTRLAETWFAQFKNLNFFPKVRFREFRELAVY